MWEILSHSGGETPVARYLYRRGNSPYYWFELKIPKDVQGKLGMSRVRRSTQTDSLRKATRIANIWAETVWADIEAARGNDWDLHVVKSGLRDLQGQGLTPEEIDDIALDVLSGDDSKYHAYERASNKVVVLVDHLEGYLKWCDDKGNSPKTLRAKRIMLGQFVEKFRQLEDVTEYNIRRWASERDIKGSTQRSIKSFCNDFFSYLGQEILFKTLDASVFDGLTTKAVNNKHKEVLSGEAFKKLLGRNQGPSVLKDILMLLAYTGRRSIAVANLECEDVVTINGIRCFRIRTDKGMRPGTHKPHIVPIHPRLHDIVDRLLRDREGRFLLPLRGDTPEKRSEALQSLVDKTGRGEPTLEVTSHQFRTSVITMLHNSPEELPDKAIYSVVGHSLSKDAHMKNYMAGLKPEALLKTVEAINWDNWEWH